MTRVIGKNIIITGASGGLGKQIAFHVAKNGGNPVLVARQEEKLRKIQQELIDKYKVSCSYYSVDLTDLNKWELTLHQILSERKTIDALINNAGIGIFSLIEDSNWDDTERMMKLNVLSLIKGVQQILPHFLTHEKGHIVNIASIAGKISTPKSAVYGATKHAVIGFTNALRLEVASKGIQITTVNLGPVRTNFFKVADPSGSYQSSVDKFMLDPDQVAKRIVNSLFTNKREINLPYWMDIGSRLYQLFPSLIERVLQKQFNKK
ncbi:SDR family NAD(P)-dependent oxidoreductase [Aquibacillus saliphilus]|uniref:SDR family NAD(P)-dependent oxidoreductase n=1 Tax=Aquibacillus saliphilus TaxID=1909422 RepID=UPI0034E2AC5D